MLLLGTDLMLLLGTENNVKFRLAVSGTAQPPTVRVLLYLPTTVMFDASPELDGRWSVNIHVPEDTVPGSYKMAVEVTVSNRVFVPLKSDIDIKRVEFEIDEMTFTPKRKPKEIEPEFEPIEERVAPKVAPKQTKSSKKPIIARDTGVSDLLLKALREQKAVPAPVNPAPIAPIEPKVVPAPANAPIPTPVIAPHPAPEPVQIPADVPRGPSVAEMLLKTLKEHPVQTPKVIVQVPIAELISQSKQNAAPVPKSSALGDLLLNSLKEYAENPPVIEPIIKRRAQIETPVEAAQTAKPQVSDLLLRIFKEKNTGETIEAKTSAIAEAIVKNVSDSGERNRLLELAGIQVQEV